MSESIPEIAKDVWKNNRPVAVVVIVVIVAIGYVAYKRNASSVVATTPIPTPAPAGAVGTGGSYTDNTYITNVTHVGNPPTPVPPPKKPPVPGKSQTIFPAPKGSLKPPQGAGKGDTNWWPWLILPGYTLGSAASKIAGWGTNYQQLVNYRNNAAIFGQMGIDTNNPNSPLLPGWSVSV